MFEKWLHRINVISKRFAFILLDLIDLPLRAYAYVYLNICLPSNRGRCKLRKPLLPNIYVLN